MRQPIAGRSGAQGELAQHEAAGDVLHAAAVQGERAGEGGLLERAGQVERRLQRAGELGAAQGRELRHLREVDRAGDLAAQAGAVARARRPVGRG